MGAQEPRWSVTGAGWKDLRPDLSDEVIALLAAPVVASVDDPGPVGASVDDPGPVWASVGDPGPVRASVDDPSEPEDEERYPSPAEPCAVTPYGQRVARFLAPTAVAGRAAA